MDCSCSCSGYNETVSQSVTEIYDLFITALAKNTLFPLIFYCNHYYCCKSYYFNICICTFHVYFFVVVRFLNKTQMVIM